MIYVSYNVAENIIYGCAFLLLLLPQNNRRNMILIYFQKFTLFFMLYLYVAPSQVFCEICVAQSQVFYGIFGSLSQVFY